MASKLILILFPKKIVGIRLLRSIWGFSFQAQILHWIKSLFSHLGTTKGTFWHFEPKNCLLRSIWEFSFQAQILLWIKSLFSHLGTTKGTFWHFRTKKLSLEIDLGIFISSANPALNKIIIFPPWYYEGYFLTFSNQKIVSWDWSGNFHFKRKSCIE